MTDTCGPTSALPSMRYDLASLSWRTSEATSLWDLEMSSPTFPEWGMTRGGELYELPTPALPTVAPASSSLPTPTARVWKDTQIRREPHRPDDTDTLSRALTFLLPTPTVMDMGANYTPEQWQAWKDAQKAAHRNGNGHGASLTQEAISLLPTPTAQAAKHGETPDVTANGFGSNLWDLPTLIGGTACQEEASAEDGTIGETATTPMLF